MKFNKLFKNIFLLRGGFRGFFKLFINFAILKYMKLFMSRTTGQFPRGPKNPNKKSSSINSNK
jgi:hypothetical protein